MLSPITTAELALTPRRVRTSARKEDNSPPPGKGTVTTLRSWRSSAASAVSSAIGVRVVEINDNKLAVVFEIYAATVLGLPQSFAVS